MPEVFGEAFWPGVKGFLSCRYTCSQGISPGVATLVVPFQAEPIPPEGTLTITDNVNPPIKLPNCRVASASVVEVQGGAKALALQILDRRWAWKYGRVYGWYNQPDPYPDPLGLPAGAEFTTVYGPFVPGTVRTPEQLMNACWELLGEKDVKYVGVPAEVRPAQDWAAANPAAALQQVADALDCRVCYQPANGDKVKVIARDHRPDYNAAGAWPVLEDHPGVKLQPPPDGFLFCTAPLWVCRPVPLEPVGPEKDGVWKPIDELSYKPDGGWGKYTGDSAVSAMTEKGSWDTLDDAKKAARQYVWRSWRPKVSDESPLPAIGQYVPKVTRPRQIEFGSRVYFPEKDITGQYKTEDAYLTGDVYKFTASGGRVENETPGKKLKVKPNFDAARGLVFTDKRLYRLNAESASWLAEVPDLWVVTSFKVRGEPDNQFAAWERYDGPKDIRDVARAKGRSPAAEVVHRPELWAVYVAGFGADPRKPVKAEDIKSNEADLKDAAKHYLKAAKARYENAESTTRVYAGVFPLDPAGVVEQVTWSVGGGGPATTTVSVSTEHDGWTPPYAERRRNERSDRLIQADDEKRVWNQQRQKFE